MMGEDDTVCIHCNSQCWMEGDDCQERRVKKTRVSNTMDGFFVRLLILDDIKENQKTESAAKAPSIRSSHSPERISYSKPPR